MGDALQHHCLTRTRRRNNQATLALAHGRDQIDYPRGIIFVIRVKWQFKRQLVFWIERRQIIKIDAMTYSTRFFKIDCLDFEKGKISLAILGRSDFTFNSISCPQAKPTHLTRGYIDIIGPGQII